MSVQAGKIHNFERGQISPLHFQKFNNRTKPILHIRTKLTISLKGTGVGGGVIMIARRYGNLNNNLLLLTSE